MQQWLQKWRVQLSYHFYCKGIQTRERPASFVKRLVSLVVKSTGVEAIDASIATRVYDSLIAVIKDISYLICELENVFVSVLHHLHRLIYEGVA